MFPMLNRIEYYNNDKYGCLLMNRLIEFYYNEMMNVDQNSLKQVTIEKFNDQCVFLEETLK